MAAYTTIDNPELYFNTVVFTGDVVDGDGTYHDQAVTGVGFEPDLLWHKGVTGARPHYIVDSVRGQGGSPTEMKHISSSATAEETTTNTNGHIKSLDSDGWTAVSGSDSSSRANNSCLNGEKYVGWCWKESADAGFDIVSWTGNGSSQNISHSLSAVPHFMITKNRSATGDWSTYHKFGGGTKTFYLSNSDAIGTTISPWNNTDPTSSVFTVGGGAYTNGDGNSIIGYLWTEKQGYSKFGSYTGNGSATDGIFVYLGFKPAWLLVKQSSAAGEGWYMWDNKRSSSGGANENNRYLIASANNAEGTLGVDCDFLSNGFKHYYSGDASNGSSDTYIYMAFAEAPFVNSEGVPCNAK